MPKSEETGEPNYLAFGAQIFTTLTEHSLKDFQLRQFYRRYGFLPPLQNQPYGTLSKGNQQYLSQADKQYLWENTIPQLFLALLQPGSALTHTEVKFPYPTRKSQNSIQDAKITYHYTFLIPPIQGSPLPGGLLQIPLSLYFEDLDPDRVRKDADILKTILLNSDYPKCISCLFDVSKEKGFKDLLKEDKSFKERLANDRKLWVNRYNAIGKDLFFPDWVLRVLRKIPTISEVQESPTEKQIALSNSTHNRFSIFYSGIDQSDEKQLTADEKLFGLALLFGFLDPDRDLILNTCIFREDRGEFGTRLGSYRQRLVGLSQGFRVSLIEENHENLELDENLSFTQTVAESIETYLEESPCSDEFDEWIRITAPDKDPSTLFEEKPSDWTVFENEQQF